MPRWTVKFTAEARRDLKRLSSADRQRTLKFIDHRLLQLENPRMLGEALSGPLAGLWKFRVGQIRVIATIIDETVIIEVARIGQRGGVYRR